MGSDASPETGRLVRAVVKHPRDAFISQDAIDAQWKGLNFAAAPDFARAIDEYERFASLLEGAGVELWWLARDEGLTLDSIYTRDASLATARGSILCSMGKPQRSGEPAVQGRELEQRGALVLGEIARPGLLEGGDVVWLDARTIAVGQGRRTNAEGIQQLQSLLGDSIDELIVVPLPEWESPQDVLHLMSLISPIDDDLVACYPRLMPPFFRQRLLDRGCQIVDVPDDEYESMGTNVLALAPRVCVMVKGNPQTRRALERAGAVVHEYEGNEISLKGGGGPTCLTRPLLRGASR